MEYYSAIKKNAFESVLLRWMKLEPIIQSEVNQKEKKSNLTTSFIHNNINHSKDKQTFLFAKVYSFRLCQALP